jgi:hypothetical protein
MQQKLKLNIELVPSSAWQNNLRGLLKKEMWEDLRKNVYKKFNYRCVICNIPTQRLHAHEVWEYDDKNHIQKLKDIIALCSRCHAVKHIGFAGIQASKGELNYEGLVKHFMKVNGCDRVVFDKHLKMAYIKFEERSKYEWSLDFSEFIRKIS